jgi:hypothetical protein
VAAQFVVVRKAAQVRGERLSGVVLPIVEPVRIVGVPVQAEVGARTEVLLILQFDDP